MPANGGLIVFLAKFGERLKPICFPFSTIFSFALFAMKKIALGFE
jgi:hypothetical protein